MSFFCCDECDKHFSPDEAFVLTSPHLRDGEHFCSLECLHKCVGKRLSNIEFELFVPDEKSIKYLTLKQYIYNRSKDLLVNTHFERVIELKDLFKILDKNVMRLKK